MASSNPYLTLIDLYLGEADMNPQIQCPVLWGDIIPVEKKKNSGCSHVYHSDDSAAMHRTSELLGNSTCHRLFLPSSSPSIMRGVLKELGIPLVLAWEEICLEGSCTFPLAVYMLTPGYTGQAPRFFHDAFWGRCYAPADNVFCRCDWHWV